MYWYKFISTIIGSSNTMVTKHLETHLRRKHLGLRRVKKVAFPAMGLLNCLSSEPWICLHFFDEKWLLHV